MAMEQAEPGGVSWTNRSCSFDHVVVVGDEAHLVDVERLRTVHIRHWYGDELELPVHGSLLVVIGMSGEVRWTSIRSVHDNP